VTRNLQFGKLVDEGISSVAERQGKSVDAVETKIAEELGYSAHTVQYWKRGHVPTQPEHVAFLVRYCVKHGDVERSWAQSLLTQALHHAPGALLAELFGEPTTDSARATVQPITPGAPRIFLCYKRRARPDASLAQSLAQALSPRYPLFFDQGALLSADQIQRIQNELLQADDLIVLVSDEAMRSELVLSQLEIVRERHHAGSPRPQLLPVRLPYQEVLSPTLVHELAGIPWTFWAGDADTPRLLQELEAALQGGKLPLAFDQLPESLYTPPHSPVSPGPELVAPQPSARPVLLELPEGTMPSDSLFYIERVHDAVALATIARRGVTITIKGPRQVGKSSLLMRVCTTARQQGKHVAFLDFQQLRPLLADADAFFRQFAMLLTYRLRLEDRSAEFWQISLPNPFRCTEYMSQYLIPTLRQPLVLAMDELDSVFDTDFRTDFFGMLRSWHNNRAVDPMWKQVDLALVTSTEPYYFIDDLNQSPFNVGEVIELQPFSVEQVAELNRRHETPLTPEQVTQLAQLVDGHPYLVRRALFLVASKRISAVDLFAQATQEQGPFGDHLRSLLTRLSNKPELLDGLRQVLQSQSCPNEVFFRLRGVGLVRRNQNQVMPSSQLYATFFREHLHE
jgi:hypothetical protein